MPMLSKILHPRRSRIQDEYINGSSLASSSEISKRLLASSSKGRTRPIAMKFRAWKDPACPVMKWYEEQTESSTEFTIIEHRRELLAPFHHEYLLIHLDDGPICRLERMGQGSRADAIRRVGCTAHDIIQWFAKDTYDNHPLSKEPSELVIQVKFPQSFDLLDVLAICFSIQKVKLSSAYTLQRYNCYFLCLTVLNVLVRRTAGWESVITNDAWVSAVDNMVNEFATMECKDEYDELGIALCAMINPDTPEPLKLILDPLREVLLESGYSSVGTELGITLWHEDLTTACHNGLEDETERAAKLALKGTDTCSLRMKQLMEQDASTEPAEEGTAKPSGTSIPPKLQRAIKISFWDEVASAWATAAKSAAVTYAMREVEDPTPLYFHLISPFMAAAISVALGFGWPTDVEDIFGLKGANAITRMRAVTRLLPSILHLCRMIFIMDSEDPILQEIEKFQDAAGNHAMIIAYGSILHSALCAGLDKYSVLHLLPFGTGDWMWYLRVCVGKHLGRILTIAEQCSSMGTINVYTPADLNGSKMTVAAFQELTIKRIHDHAERVAKVGLAAAPLVQGEIVWTMAEVWRKLPDRKNWDSPNGSNGDIEQVNPQR